MNTEDTIRVFVGCDPNNCDLEQMMVLDYSIHKHTSVPVEIVWMQLSRDPNSYWYSNPETGEGWNTTKWDTPFSGFRWAIPEYCNYSGRAIYMDTDVVILDDLLKLWNHPIDGKSIVAAKKVSKKTRMCTCVWDCSRAKSRLPPLGEIMEDADSHKRIMEMIKKNPRLLAPFNDSYNCIDGESLPIEDIKVLHYSDMGTQFSHKYSLKRLEAEGSTHWFDGEVLPHPRQDLVELFDNYYNKALTNGYQLENYRVDPFGIFPKKTQKGYVGNQVTRPTSSKSLFARLFKR